MRRSALALVTILAACAPRATTNAAPQASARPSAAAPPSAAPAPPAPHDAGSDADADAVAIAQVDASDAARPPLSACVAFAAKGPITSSDPACPAHAARAKPADLKIEIASVAASVPPDVDAPFEVVVTNVAKRAVVFETFVPKAVTLLDGRGGVVSPRARPPDPPCNRPLGCCEGIGGYPSPTKLLVALAPGAVARVPFAWHVQVEQPAMCGGFDGVGPLGVGSYAVHVAVAVDDKTIDAHGRVKIAAGAPPPQLAQAAYLVAPAPYAVTALGTYPQNDGPMQRALIDARRCYLRAVANDADLAGDVEVKLERGRTDEVHVRARTSEPAALVACAVEALRDRGFDMGGGMIVRWHFGVERR